MAELKLSGNHLKGSRPVLSFDGGFQEQPHFALIKETLTQIFATPPLCKKRKPFFDHVISFSIVDDRVWIRNYQVTQEKGSKSVGSSQDLALVEVGPRMCLNPIKILSGAFGGPILYDNPTYVPPNAIRAALKRATQSKYASKVRGREKRKMHEINNRPPKGEFTDVFKGT